MKQSFFHWQMTEVGRPLIKEEIDPLTSNAEFQISAGEVLVKVAGCGVCHTDLGFYYDGVRTNHPLPLTLGHEISGRVVETSSGSEEWLGRAVIVPAVMPCGECELCKKGRSSICRSQKMPGNDIQGGFASHIVVPAKGLCLVDEVRLEKAKLTLADVSVIADAVTTPYQAAVRAGVGEGDLAIVVGVGGIGGYAVQINAALGATVIAIDVDAEKLSALKDYGVSLTLNSKEYDGRELKKKIRDFVKEQGLPSQEWFIYECSGTGAGQATAFNLLTHGATLSVLGFTMEKTEMRLSNLMAFDARALGNWGCAPELYGAALDLVLDGKVQLAPFIEQHPLDSINEIFAAGHAHKLQRRAILVPAS